MREDCGGDLAGRFEGLIETYGAALRRLARAYLPADADQDDLFQEIALALWTALPRFRGEASQRTWLYRVAHNTALTYSGRHRRRRAAEQPLAEVGVDAGLDRHRQRAQLLEMVWQLPALDRQITLLYLEGLTAAEIEEVTGLAANNVAVRLTRVRQRLAAELEGKERHP